ncbi:hypothetical protein [Nonomuraea sp. NPDC049709]|uniref:hypothetical protein n=1 Tax=Nonomuraea sp. NPDC049709 TaxID=3154736 RepID=UPI00343276C2
MAMPSDQRKHARTRLRTPIEPMLAASVDSFPPGRPGTWAFEPKLDGFRALTSTRRYETYVRWTVYSTATAPIVSPVGGVLATGWAVTGEDLTRLAVAFRRPPVRCSR